MGRKGHIAGHRRVCLLQSDRVADYGVRVRFAAEVYFNGRHVVRIAGRAFLGDVRHNGERNFEAAQIDRS
ncbi:hypothetical protein SDC9_66018 [bioreactor metagenome]|uniref:Uncharacterized protein n=1 Tax=bioreactor metagenome TaxID=1076179 RepID=A0A644XTQ5_9ZZZZ